jgi:hypothetical protein
MKITTLAYVVFFCVLSVLPPEPVWAQAPGLIWNLNLGGRVFAVDQNNLYANAGGTVFTLDKNGVPLQTNSICPVWGWARRDDTGNFYFGGSFDGTQNFGGITLVGGWTNFLGHYSPGYPTCFLAKYSSSGALQWVTSFGSQAQVNKLTDFILDLAGGFYAGYDASNGGLFVAHLGATGSFDWAGSLPGTEIEGHLAVRLGSVTSSNCCALYVRSNSRDALMKRLDRSGNATGLGQYPLLWHSTMYTNSTVVGDDLAQPLQVGECYDHCGTQWLRKCAPGTDLYDAPIATNAEWLLARDVQGNIFVGGTNGLLAKYTDAGGLIWSNVFSQPCVAMVVDPAGNRFVSFNNGVVGRLQDDTTPQPPAIANDPQSQTVFAGDNAALNVTAVGTAPLSYQWRMNGTAVPGATLSALQFSPVAPSDAGTYSVVVTNAVGAVTSAPALLRVKSVELYIGSQMLTNGSYVFASPPTLTIRSAFTNGSSYYTLDGSTPSQSSIPYTGPFVLEHNAIVRAIGYSFGPTQSEEADTVTATVYSQHTLTVTISGDGSVLLNPPGGVYANTNTVTATAVPGLGSSFLFWLEDASGSSPSVNLSMEYDRSIIAVFGTNAPGGAAPGLLWATNIGATLFAIDSQTNLYANTGGTVFTLSGNGAVLQTNTVCPLPGIARRDSAGNFYFAGAFDGTQNFGGITLVGGWTNNAGHYSPGYPTCFLAKYSSNGTLQWVTSFGPQAYSNTVTDVAIDPAGGFYAAYRRAVGGLGVGARVAHLNMSGIEDWTWAEPGTDSFPDLYVLKLGALTTSNCAVLTLRKIDAVMSRIDRTGAAGNIGQYPLRGSDPLVANAIPVADNFGNVFQAGQCYEASPPCTAQWLRKATDNADVWKREVDPAVQWVLGRDVESTIYVAGTNGTFARYSNNGDLVWSNNFGQVCVTMLRDASDNRFVAFADGTVARLGSENTQTAFSIGGNGHAQPGLSLTSPVQDVWQIQASSNLISWWILGTVTNGSGTLQFADPLSKKASLRFYRAVPLP